MSNPMIMSPHQHAAAKGEINALRRHAASIRTNAPNAAFPDSIWAGQRAADLDRAADLERMADGIAQSIAQSNDAERAMLDADLHLARTHTLYAHRTGNIDDMEGAVALERAALQALVEFNLRTIRMVPVTHVRR